MNRLIIFSADEYKKLLRHTKIKVLLALTIIYSITMGIFRSVLENKTGIELMTPGRFPVFLLELLTGLALPVLLIFIGSELFASEFKDSTIKNLFALPVSKSIIYLGKLLAGAALLATILLTLAFSGLIVNTVISGLAAFTYVGSILVSYLGAFVYLVMVLLIVSFLTLLTGSPNMSIVISLLIWIVTGIAGTFVASVRPFLPTNFASWYQPIVNQTNFAAAVPELLYMLSYCVLFAVIGLIIFERKEV